MTSPSTHVMTPPERARHILSLLDLTSLGDDDTRGDIERLCADASTPYGPVAAVCVWPRFVELASRLLTGYAVRVAAVANFPDGDADPVGAAEQASRIVAAGGHEVDVVVPWRSVLAGASDDVVRMVETVRAEIGDAVTLKAILETGELRSPEAIEAAARAAVQGGADFLKTSTGKTEHGASVAAVETLLRIAHESRGEGRHVGVKVSGGVRTFAAASSYLDAADSIMGSSWTCVETFRFGASGLLADLESVIAAGAAPVS